MVAGVRPAAVPAQFDVCNAFDRNRRASAANTRPAAGVGRRCADRLPGEPAPGPRHGRGLPNTANRLRFANRLRPKVARRLVRRQGRGAAGLRFGWRDLRRWRIWRDFGLRDFRLGDFGLGGFRLGGFRLKDFGLKDFRFTNFGLQDFGFKDFGLRDFGLKDFGLDDFGLQDFWLQDFWLRNVGLRHLWLGVVQRHGFGN